VLLLKPQNGQTEALSDALVPHSGQYTNPISIDLLGAVFMLKHLERGGARGESDPPALPPKH